MPICSGLSVHVVGSGNTPPRFLSGGGATWLISSMIPPAHRCTCGVCAQWGQNPLDRQSMGDWQFEQNFRPKRKFSSNCQSPVDCLSPCRSIREYTPRFSLKPGIHPKVLAQSGNTFRGSPLLEGAHAGFALSGAQTPVINRAWAIDSCRGDMAPPPTRTPHVQR